jgi:hypothetical protein
MRCSAAERLIWRPALIMPAGALAMTLRVVWRLFGIGGSPSRTLPQMSRSKSSAVIPGMGSKRLRNRSRFMAGRPKK